jgi:hypothetical protein
VNKNHLDELFILSLFCQSTSTYFGHICSPSSYICIYICIYTTTGTFCAFQLTACWPANLQINYSLCHLWSMYQVLAAHSVLCISNLESFHLGALLNTKKIRNHRLHSNTALITLMDTYYEHAAQSIYTTIAHKPFAQFYTTSGIATNTSFI